MLWDLIRDFFVQHVFGGIDSSGEYFLTTIGNIQTESGGLQQGANNTDLYFSLGDGYIDGSVISGHSSLFISMGDWLSTTATIISITIIVVLCCLFVYKIIKLIGGLIR